MSRLMAPTSSPTSTSTRESVARADRASPRVPAAASAAPAAAAAPTNFRLPIFAMCPPRPRVGRPPSLLQRLHADRVPAVLRGAEPVEHHLEVRREAAHGLFERHLVVDHQEDLVAAPPYAEPQRLRLRRELAVVDALHPAVDAHPGLEEAVAAEQPLDAVGGAPAEQHGEDGRPRLQPLLARLRGALAHFGERRLNEEAFAVERWPAARARARAVAPAHPQLLVLHLGLAAPALERVPLPLRLVEPVAAEVVLPLLHGGLCALRRGGLLPGGREAR